MSPVKLRNAAAALVSVVIAAFLGFLGAAIPTAVIGSFVPLDETNRLPVFLASWFVLFLLTLRALFKGARQTGSVDS